MRSSSWWYNWKCCLVVTQSPGLPLLDEYQTTEPARMCREQSEQGLSNTLRMVVHKLWWICQFEQVCWCFMPSPYCRVQLSLSSQTTSHYEHHPSFYTQQRCMHWGQQQLCRAPHSHYGWFIHIAFIAYIFFCFCGRCVSSGGSLTILGEYAQKHWSSGELPFRSSMITST